MELLLVLLFGTAALFIGASGGERTPEAPRAPEERSIAPFRITGLEARMFTRSMYPQSLAPALMNMYWHDNWTARWLGGLDALAAHSLYLHHDIYSYMADHFRRMDPVFAYSLQDSSGQRVATAVVRWTGRQYILQDAQGPNDTLVPADVVQHIDTLLRRMNRA